MIGFKSGLLTVIAQAKTVKRRRMWICLCSCGNLHTVMGKYLRRGEVKSCGCLHRQPILGYKKHGHTIGGKFSPTYSTWASMIQRCNNPKSTIYYKYGARGIIVCNRWLNFKNFLADMGERPSGKTIDRKNNLLNYTPNNCRWATLKEQAQNTRTNRIIEFDGEKKCLTEWARTLKIAPCTLHARLKRGSLKKTMTMKGGLAHCKSCGVFISGTIKNQLCEECSSKISL